MPRPFSLDLRQRILDDVLAGMSYAEAGRKYSVSAEFVRRFYARYLATQEIAPRPPIPRVVPFHRRHETAIREAVEKTPGLTLELLRTQLGLDVSIGTLRHALQQLKLTFKKTILAAEQQRPDVVRQRAEFHFFRIAGIDPHRLIFLDETWIKTNTTRLWGWGPKGQRIVDSVPHRYWMTTTYLAAMRSTGLFAPLLVNGAINGEIFRAYVQQHLAPQLKSGDIVVMDNLRCHKVSGVAEAIESVGASLVYLPPYNPDWNPIEMVFSKVKYTIRMRAPRTKDECDRLCGESLDWFPAHECDNSIRHAGYARQQSH